MRTRSLIIALLALAHVVPARAQPAATGAKVAVSGHVYLDRDGRPGRGSADDGVADVAVEVVWDPPWDQSRMSEDARLALNMF